MSRLHYELANRFINAGQKAILNRKQEIKLQFKLDEYLFLTNCRATIDASLIKQIRMDVCRVASSNGECAPWAGSMATTTAGINTTGMSHCFIHDYSTNRCRRPLLFSLQLVFLSPFVYLSGNLPVLTKRFKNLLSRWWVHSASAFISHY